MSEQFCPDHGPFDEPVCPVCGYSAQRSPQPPRPLSSDDLPTDLGYHPGIVPPSPDMDEEESPTEIPSQRARRGFLDVDEEEETQIGRNKHEDMTELEEPAGGSLALLWVIEGHRRGHIYKIAKGTKIGREEGDVLRGDIILDDPKVSSLHCKITMEDDDFLIWDFGSANGTYVNERRIREATVLKENDLVKIGSTKFVVKLLEPKMKTRPAARNTTARKSSTGRRTAKG
jgi:hypothetical protein